jgi:sarcosine oxidase subunit beta
VSSIFVPDAETFPATADAVVIGGGIVGTATAFWLSKAGLDTVVIERRDGLGTLTTAKSAECVRAQFTEPAMAALARPSLDFFERFAEEAGLPGAEIGLRQRGYLFLTADPEAIPTFQQTVMAYQGVGLADAEYLDAADIRRRFPWAAPAALAATFRQRDGWLSANELTYALARASAARFLLCTSALGLRLEGGAIRAVATDRGLMRTPVVVDAAGPYAAAVARMAGVELPIQTVRRQKVVVALPDGGWAIPEAAPMTIDVDNGSYWRPEAGGALMGWVDPDEPPSPPKDDVPADWDFPALVLEKVSRLTPFWRDVSEHLKQTDIHASAGQYSYTPDDQPLLGPVDEVPGLHLNCGYWAGVMLSPEAGRQVAAMITGQLNPAGHPLRLGRFAAGAPLASSSLLRGRH